MSRNCTGDPGRRRVVCQVEEEAQEITTSFLCVFVCICVWLCWSLQRAAVNQGEGRDEAGQKCFICQIKDYDLRCLSQEHR